jgi:sigma-E factor negative regulatory protein RseA
MSEHIRESLSALMDSEASELELQRILQHSDDESLRGSWQRYHAVRHVLHEPGPQGNLEIDLSLQIREAIAAQESAATIKPVARWHSFMRPAASFAVAASVFATVLVGSQFYGLMGLQSPEQGSAAAAQMATRASPVGLVNTLGGAVVNASYATPAIKSSGAGQRSTYNHLAHQRLQRYLLPHAEEAALNVPQGMMPFARVSAWQVEQ